MWFYSNGLGLGLFVFGERFLRYGVETGDSN